jgi:hypothetical protein
LFHFGTLLDTPQVRTVNFHPLAMTVRTFNPLHLGGTVTSFVDDVLYHVDIHVDLSSDSWTVSVDGRSKQSAFGSTGGDLDRVRFSLAPWHGDAVVDPTVFIGLDNVRISSVGVAPEPSTALLMSLGLGMLAIRGRSRSTGRSSRRNSTHSQEAPSEIDSVSGTHI